MTCSCSGAMTQSLSFVSVLKVLLRDGQWKSTLSIVEDALCCVP